MHSYWYETHFRKLSNSIRTRLFFSISFFCLGTISSKFTHKVSVYFVICSNFPDSHSWISVPPSLYFSCSSRKRLFSLPLKHDWELHRYEIKVLLSSYRTMVTTVTFLWVSLLVTISYDTMSYHFSTTDVCFLNILKHSQYGVKILMFAKRKALNNRRKYSQFKSRFHDLRDHQTTSNNIKQRQTTSNNMKQMENILEKNFESLDEPWKIRAGIFDEGEIGATEIRDLTKRLGPVATVELRFSVIYAHTE